MVFFEAPQEPDLQVLRRPLLEKAALSLLRLAAGPENWLCLLDVHGPTAGYQAFDQPFDGLQCT